MQHRALLVGARTGRLRGADVDARTMRDTLADRGFATDLRIGSDATRDGILDGLRALAAAVGNGDAAVFYYSGHGGRAFNIDPAVMSGRRGDVPREVGFLVPTDYDADPDGFRGISEWELSFHLAALTSCTRNVVAIHDCCHAESVVRGRTESDQIPRARSLANAARHDLRGHFDALLARGARFETLWPNGNPHAVRLAAAGRSDLAWERASPDGQVRGDFTSELAAALHDSRGEQVTWSWLFHAIRERMLRHGRHQRPELHGPRRRVLFTLTEPCRRAELHVALRGGRAQLQAGEVHGVRSGDVIRIERLVPGGRLATPVQAVVGKVGPFESELELAGPLRRADGAVAVPADPREPAHAAWLRALVGNHGLSTDSIRLAVEPVDQAAAHDASATPPPANRVLVRIENLAPHPIYGHAFLLDCEDRVSLVSHAVASGLAIAPGAVELVGAVAGIGPVGLRIPPVACRWAGIAAHRCATELVVVATTVPVELGELATPEPSIAGQVLDRDDSGWPLNDIAVPLQCNVHRYVDLGEPEPTPVGFAVVRTLVNLPPGSTIRDDRSRPGSR